jgi:hypothetical protein
MRQFTSRPTTSGRLFVRDQTWLEAMAMMREGAMERDELANAVEQYRLHLDDCKNTIYADMGFDKEMYDVIYRDEELILEAAERYLGLLDD